MDLGNGDDRPRRYCLHDLNRQTKSNHGKLLNPYSLSIWTKGARNLLKSFRRHKFRWSGVYPPRLQYFPLAIFPTWKKGSNWDGNDQISVFISDAPEFRNRTDGVIKVLKPP